LRLAAERPRRPQRRRRDLDRLQRHRYQRRARAAGCTVSLDGQVAGRKRGAISLPAVLRQVRAALDPGYARNKVRVALTTLVPS
jgi:hypothetical protein